MRKFIWRLVVIVLVIFGAKMLFFTNKTDIGPCTEYKCDVKNFRLSTTIEIKKEDEEYAKVKGNIFRYITDPLTMYDTTDKETAYAGDDYHLIAQDSHVIHTYDEEFVEMVGKINFFGNSYDIYTEEGKIVASVSFNWINTNGNMYDTEGNLIADFNSKLFFNDFDVRIKDECNLNEKTVLMIFCSYYSDQHEDSN